MGKGDSGGNSPSAGSTARLEDDRLVVGPGDHVTIAVDEHQLKILQKNFGGCTLRMMRVSLQMKKKVSSVITRQTGCSVVVLLQTAPLSW